MKEWIHDFDGRTVVVTGANSGLGFEATKLFVEAGARVVMACRSIDRARRALEEIEREEPAGQLELMELDLADLESVERFARDYENRFEELHVLCNNAGIMAIPRQETRQGFEKQFGVNHLGHFALTGRLLEGLRQTPGETRVVTQSSMLHQRGEMNFDDLQAEISYDKWGAYCQSKLANLLFTRELQRRLEKDGAEVISLGCHPGYSATNLQYRGPEESGSIIKKWLMKAANTIVAQSARQGALPMVYASVSPELQGGEFIGPDGFQAMWGDPETQEPASQARNDESARRLWKISEELTGVSYL